MKKVQLLLLLLIFGLFGNSPGCKVHYICFGDSATRGFGVTTKPYPTWLQDFLIEGIGEQPGSVANQGKDGDTACDPIATNPATPNTRLQDILKDPNTNQPLYPNAHTVLYWLGVNDLRFKGRSIDEIKSCITSHVDAITSAGLNVYLGTYFYPAKNIDDWHADIDRLNAAIREVGDKMGITVAPIDTLDDKYGYLCDPDPDPICCTGVLGPNCYVDGFHANSCGNELVAKVWYQTMFPGQQWSRQDCKQ